MLPRQPTTAGLRSTPVFHCSINCWRELLWGSQVQVLSHTACSSTPGPVRMSSLYRQDQGIFGSLQQQQIYGQAVSTYLT